VSEDKSKAIEALEIDDDRWIIALDNLQDGEVCSVRSTAFYTSEPPEKPQEILIDSGSEVTVCPSSFVHAVGTRPAETTMNLRAADGSSIAHHGAGEVSFELQASDGLQKATMKFQVAGVFRPVASISELMNKGFDVHFVGGQCWIACNGPTVDFTRRGNRFMLPVFGVGRNSPRSKLKEILCFEPEAGSMELFPLGASPGRARDGVRQPCGRSACFA
jgi:hypothetical protein